MTIVKSISSFDLMVLNINIDQDRMLFIYLIASELSIVVCILLQILKKHGTL